MCTLAGLAGELDAVVLDIAQTGGGHCVEIVVEDFNFIGGSDGGNFEGGSNSSRGGKKATKAAETDDIAPDDISDDPIDLSEIPF